MSVVRDLILQADDDLRYPTSGELRTMVDFLDQGAMRVSVVKVLTENEKRSSTNPPSNCLVANLSTSPLAAMPTVSASGPSASATTAGTSV